MDAHQQTAIEALGELKRICDRFGIRFYLLAGSCLGAVRHGGMIPWDDDIDVGLLREDWLRLQKILPTEKYPCLYGKILFEQQSCIDVFLIAEWTHNRFLGTIHWLITKIIYACYTVTSNNIIRYPRRPEWSDLRFLRNRVVYYAKKLLRPVVCFFFEREDFIRLARWNERFFEGKKTEWYINLYSVYSMKKEMLRAEWLEDPAQVQFEGETYDTVGDTDAYLRHLCGDYMTLPPEEKRVKMHQEAPF